MAHGHPGYYGEAWYRRTVSVPAGAAAWDIPGPPLVEGDQNGRRLCGWGRLGPNLRLSGAVRCALRSRPVRQAPAACSPSAPTCCPVPERAWMAGGLHTAPILAPARK